MEAICNNNSCVLGKSKKVFQVNDLSSQCPSCGLNSLLPKTALKYKMGKEHKHHQKLQKSKSKIKETLDKSNLIKKNSKNSSNSSERNSPKSLKSIELSYHQKLSKLSSSIKNDKLISKFSKIDDDIITGNASLKELNKELKKIDGLFNDLKNIKEPSLSEAPSKKNKSKSSKIKSNPKKNASEKSSTNQKQNTLSK